MNAAAHISRMKANAVPAVELVDAIRDQAKSIAEALSVLNGRPYRVAFGEDARLVMILPVHPL